MSLKIIVIYFLFFLFISSTVCAEKTQLKPFVSGSYQHLLKQNVNQPFMLAIWSTTCASCLEKMALLGELQKNTPEINIVMLAMDDISVSDQIQTVLAKNELTSLDNWVFADKNAQKLRYEIDPKWFGELPRTYFLNKKHERQGISGALSRKDYETIFKVILN